MSEIEALLRSEGLSAVQVFCGPATECPLCSMGEAPELAA